MQAHRCLLGYRRRNAAVGLDDAPDRDVDVGKDIGGSANDADSSEDEFEGYHHDEGIGAPQRRFQDEQGILPELSLKESRGLPDTCDFSNWLRQSHKQHPGEYSMFAAHVDAIRMRVCSE